MVDIEWVGDNPGYQIQLEVVREDKLDQKGKGTLDTEASLLVLVKYIEEEVVVHVLDVLPRCMKEVELW